MLYVAQFVEPRRWLPGTVLTVPSDVKPFKHFLMVEFINFHTGQEMALHSMPGVGVARAPLLEIVGTKRVTVHWSPPTPEDGEAAVLRTQELIGHPYDLVQANCEHVIRWAITGEWESKQVSGVGGAAIFGALLGIAVSL